jgi:prophage regulatory protein
MDTSNTVTTVDPGLHLLRMPKVEVITSMSKTEIYRRIAKGLFPKGICIGPKHTAWRAGDVQAWLADPVGYRAPAAE